MSLARNLCALKKHSCREQKTMKNRGFCEEKKGALFPKFFPFFPSEGIIKFPQEKFIAFGLTTLDRINHFSFIYHFALRVTLLLIQISSKNRHI